MALIVQKFGGSSVADASKMLEVARRIAKNRKAGNDVVVVVSAPGDTTDDLIAMAQKITEEPDDREMDVLLATGEQQAIALLAIALKSLDCDAISFTGPQVGIVTDDVHTKARIVKVGDSKIRSALKLGKVVIVAGFQGMNKDQEITTLGRGGSDLTAVAIAAALQADVCEFYKDVDGVFTANPNIVKNARKLNAVSYDEMLEMASAGAQVLNARSVEFAKNFGIKIHVRPTFNEKEGTYVMQETKAMEKVVISGVTYNKGEAKVTVRGVPDRPGVASILFSKLANAGLNVDMIIQNVGEKGHSDVSFTVNRSELKKTMKVVADAAKTLKPAGVISDENIAKVSVVGVGMKSHSGVAAKMFQALAEKGVNILMISTSEIKISVVIDEKDVAKAVNVIHEKFKLEKRRRTSVDKKLVLYDALLREGPQTEGINLSVKDKLNLLELLDSLGLHYIEGGWPGANPKDTAFFQEARKMKIKAKLSAFGMTRRVRQKAHEDVNLLNLVSAKTSTITVVGKSSDMQVTKTLGISLEQNLEIIYDSIKFLRSKTDEVFYDAEHFFDGYKENPEFTLKCLEAALHGGADVLVLCDTNGGSLPEDIEAVVTRVTQRFPGVQLGIHAHNDSDLAVANSLAALEAGAVQVQGCINGYGERVGNTNLTSIIPNLLFKKQATFIRPVHVEKLTEVSRRVDEILNMKPRANAPYVGQSAFTHKGGMHISAVSKLKSSYEHLEPEKVGNQRKVILSDQAGVAAVLSKATAGKIKLNKDTPEAKAIIEKVKQMESEGYQFESAEASFEILLKKALGQHRNFFNLVGFRVIVENRGDGKMVSEATIKLTVNGVTENTVGEGDGPVNALDNALRKALTKFYPSLKDVRLTDYKVRVLDAKDGTAAKVRVLIESQDGKDSWGTVGVSENSIGASWDALVDSIDYKLLKDSDRKAGKTQKRSSR